MTKSALMIDIDDPRATDIAMILSNKTCKKILAALADGEMTESEISSVLKIPLNTVGYNIKKLVDAGLIERDRRFFWSAKGKRLHRYTVSNKKIVISPRLGVKGVIPALIVSVIAAFGIKIWSDTRFAAQRMAETERSLLESSGASLTATDAAQKTGEHLFDSGMYGALFNAPDFWAWYLLGALTVLLIVILWNWRNKL